MKNIALYLVELHNYHFNIFIFRYDFLKIIQVLLPLFIS